MRPIDADELLKLLDERFGPEENIEYLVRSDIVNAPTVDIEIPEKAHKTFTPRKDPYGDDPMIGIIWYNGLEEIVIKWKDYKKGDDAPYWAYNSSLNDGDYRQLEMVWMYLVLCFGDYGTSPRGGWIEDFEGYKKWFEELEELMKPVP